jgi:stage V sporulation protein SpoVS
VSSTSSPIKVPGNVAPKLEKHQKPEVQKIKKTDKRIYI